MDESKTKKRAYSVAEFCDAYGISRASFYILSNKGNAPASFQVGRRRLIMVEAAQAWADKLTALASEL
jgi:predicted DNA-binding transcriptional regulator AlpA